MEKENSFKIETFFKRSFFDVAYNFAKEQNADYILLAEISKLHGDHLYVKGDYQNSIKNYIKTIGYIEPSYIIRKFLDVSQIEYLIEYLEAIHKKKLADKHHTALLLNCYVKQKSINKLEEFLKESKFDSDLFDIETAIKVCRELKYFELALKLAEQRNQSDYYLDILIENIKNYDSAIQYIINQVQLDDKTKFVLEFGQTLMKQEPDNCLQLIQNLVMLSIIAQDWKKKSSPEPNAKQRNIFQFFNLNQQDIDKLVITTFRKPDEFLHIFVMNPTHLQKYLVFLTKDITNLQNPKSIFHRLFEFHLEQYKENQNAFQSENAIMDLLQENIDNEKKFEKNHLLILFKMYQFFPGIVYLCEQMQLKEELMNFYITNKQGEDIINLCKKYGQSETNLWIQALKYFTKKGNKDDEKIAEILEETKKIDSLSSLLIVNILCKGENPSFGVMKDYFTHKIQFDRQNIIQDQKIVKQNQLIVDQKKKEYISLKTQAQSFSQNKCAECESQLSLPSVHFMCFHSFHKDCLNQQEDKITRECNKCILENDKKQERKKMFENEINDTKLFKEKLDQTPNKFDVIAQYLGKGLFNKKQSGNQQL